MNYLRAIGERWRAFAVTPLGKGLQRVASGMFLIALLGYLAYRLTAIGWGEVLRALPDKPLFYLLFLGIYFTLPLAESVVYGYLWHFKLYHALPVFLRKRVYNKDVLGYSGEVYLYLWAHRTLGLTRRQAFKDIRDNTIVSSVVSTVVAIVLLAVFLMAGQVQVPGLSGRVSQPLYLAGGGGLLLIASILLFRFRRYFFGFSRRQTLVIAGIHLTRLLLVNTFQVLQWAVVMPQVPWSVWFTFLSAQIVLNRIPFLPSRDLVFLGTGVELSSVMQLSTVDVAGMLLVSAVLGKVLNFVLLLFLTFQERRQRGDVPEEAAEMLPAE